MGLTWCPGVVESKRVWTDGLFTLAVRVDGVLPFEPGQFLQLGLETAGEKEVHRPYSVASPHGEVVEFYIVRVDEGELTPRLWNLQPGDVVQISQRAAGSFTLAHAPRHPDLWLIGTGTGLAPYVAMLRTPVPWHSFERIVVVHGVRFCRDLSYVDEFQQYAAKYGKQFRYVPMATREECPQGISGRITARLQDGGLEQFVGCQFGAVRSTVLLCGNPDMLDEMEALLLARGLAKHRKKTPGNIVVERYW